MALIQLRRGTAAQWAAADTVLASGEVGVETDTGYLKVGNGVDPWNVRPYQQGPPGPSAYTVAVENGFVGSEADWLASLKGTKGDPGPRGLRGEGLHIDGRVATYGALPPSPPPGTGLIVDADELLYIFDAAAGWPAEGDGVALGVSPVALAGKADLVDGKIPQAQIPAVALTDFLGVVGSQSAMLALPRQRGDWCTRSDLGTDWQLIADSPSTLTSWREHTYPASPVSSVAGRTGAVVLAKADITDWPTNVLRGTVVTALPGTPDPSLLYLIPE